MKINVRRSLATVGVLACSAFVSSAALVVTANAGTDSSYCNGCKMYTQVTSGQYHYLTNSYVHYLGDGNRYLAAGSPDYAAYVLSFNEVSHPYAGDHNIRPAAQNAGSSAYVTVNAHGTY